MINNNINTSLNNDEQKIIWTDKSLAFRAVLRICNDFTHIYIQ